MKQFPGRIDLRKEHDCKRYVCLSKYTCIQSCCNIILTTPEGVREIDQNDWICFDQNDTISVTTAKDFESLFTPNECEESGPCPVYSRKHEVLAKKMSHRFSAYADTLRTQGNSGDYLIQDTVHPFHQSVCRADEFASIYSNKNTHRVITTQLSTDTIDIPNTPDSARYTLWGPPIRNHSDPIDSVLGEPTAAGLTERTTLNLTPENALLCRQHSGSYLAFKLCQVTSVWKCKSGQGGRCYGGIGDMLVVHATGDIEGIFSKQDFIKHFRCTEVDVGIIDMRASDVSDVYTICTESTPAGTRQALSRIYDALALKMMTPFVAYTDTGVAQFGNAGDYLVQASLPRPLTCQKWVGIEERNDAGDDDDDSFLGGSECSDAVDGVRHTGDDMASRVSVMEEVDVGLHGNCTAAADGSSGLREVDQLENDEMEIFCQWVVSGSMFESQYFQVNAYRDERQCSKVSDLTVADQLDMFRIQHKGVPNISAQPFDVYSSSVMCWEGPLKKRTKLLRQWQVRHCELYPDKIVIGDDQDGSRSFGDIDSSRTSVMSQPPVSPRRTLTNTSDRSAYICLKNCSVHQTVIDDHPVIYLGNARMNDDDSKPLPLEPFHVTSDLKRWESRYAKLVAAVASPATGLLITSKSMGDINTSKTTGHMSFSNKGGIFLMALDAATHNAVVSLLEGCILFCRREMVFEAAKAGNCPRALEVLCSVSPNDALRIVSCPNDAHSGRLLQHEAARTSKELLQEIFQLLDYRDHARDGHSVVSLGSADDEGRGSLTRKAICVQPDSTCAKGMNCLHYAVEADQWDVVKFLLEGDFPGIGVNSTTLSGATPLHFANTSKIALYLIEKGANPVALDFEGNNAIMLMTGRGSFAAITAVIRSVPVDNAYVNTQSWKTGLTALMIAINRLSRSSSDYSDVLILVELLLHYGADPEICDVQKNTCLHCVCSIFRAACSDNSSDPKRRKVTQNVIDACSKIMKILIDYGSSKKAINAKGHIPFTIIAQSKNYALDKEVIVAVLDTVIFARKTVHADEHSTLSDEDYQLDCSEILNFRTESGASCLHLAVEAINPDMLQYLLEKGVDANCKDMRAFTPLDVLKSKQLRAGGGMVERQATDLLRCLKILYDHGAVRRLRADLPVEQDSDDIIFSRLLCGRYQVKSATVDAMVKRLCNDRLYCDDDACALVLGYRSVCTDVDLMQKILDEFQDQVEAVRRSRLSAAELDGEDITQLSASDVVDMPVPPLNHTRTSSSHFAKEIDERRRTVSGEHDLPRGVRATRRTGSDVNEWDELHGHTPLQKDEILRPGGILSLLMIWFNVSEARIDDAGEEFFILAKQVATMILRNCPEELCRESIALLNMGLSPRGMKQHIRRGLACMYKSKAEKQRSFNIDDCDVQRSMEACQLDDILDTTVLAPAYKKQFVNVLVGSGDSLTSIRPIEFAQQVTLMQHHMFSKITVEELLSMKYRDGQTCPNLKTMRDWNNNVTNFLVNEILLHPSVAARADFIAFLITSAFICIEVMNNFDFAVIVLGVLESTPIYRLKATWEKVEKLVPGKRDEFKKIVGIAGRNVASLMSKCAPPLVPYVGCFLQKLVNLNEVPSTLENGHVNVTKFRGIAFILNSHHEAQKVSYKIQIDAVFQTLLIAPTKWTTEDEFVARSRELEPPIARNT